MDLSEATAALARQVRDAPVVVPTGARSQWEVGGPAPSGVEVGAPAGVVRHEPADLTVTVGAGTPVRELAAVLARAGQECPLDPSDAGATVGGVLACGLSGWRRLGHGPVRDHVLEVRFVTADGRVAKGGGPTVKNVSGYDLPRLLVGSMGTLGVLAQVTLRCAARPPQARWVAGEVDPVRLRREVFRPSCIAWDGQRTWCLVEGHEADVDARCRATGLGESRAPSLPSGDRTGRISVRPGRLGSVGQDLDAVTGLEWLAEIGVGTVRVAARDAGAFLAARRVAERHGGWLLREAGDGVDGFGRGLPNRALARRLKDALDPDGKLNPGRLPW